MHPAPSIIIFTTLSGLGYGLAAVLGLGLLDPAALATKLAYLLALALISGGLMSSTAASRQSAACLAGAYAMAVELAVARGRDGDRDVRAACLLGHRRLVERPAYLCSRVWPAPRLPWLRSTARR